MKWVPGSVSCLVLDHEVGGHVLYAGEGLCRGGLGILGVKQVGFRLPAFVLVVERAQMSIGIFSDMEHAITAGDIALRMIDFETADLGVGFGPHALRFMTALRGAGFHRTDVRYCGQILLTRVADMEARGAA